MSIKLYAPFGYHRANLVKITADLAQVKLDNVDLQWSDLRDPSFLQKTPLGKAPVLETASGFIYETNAILRYIARLGAKTQSLIGNTPFESAQIDQWLDFTNLEVGPAAFALTAPVFGWDTFNKERYTLARQDIEKLLRILDDHMKLNSFLVGNQVTIADIVLVGSLHALFRFILEDNSRKTYVNVTRYFQHIAEKPYFVKYFGKPYLCTKEWELQEPPAQPAQSNEQAAAGKAEKPKKQQQAPKENKEQAAPKEGGKKEQAAPKEGGKKEQAAPKDGGKKAPQAKEAPAQKQQAEEAPEAPAEGAPEAKKKNPLDLLPASPFNLFDFKTLIVNATDKKEAVKFFFDNFDPQGYSIWYSRYLKQEGDCVRLFLTSNLRDGILQKIEDFRKYSFAQVGIYGEPGKFEIRGVWVVRSTEIPEMLREADIFESLEWKKLDPTKAEDQKLLEDYWTKLAEGDIVEGLPLADAAYFK